MGSAVSICRNEVVYDAALLFDDIDDIDVIVDDDAHALEPRNGDAETRRTQSSDCFGRVSIIRRDHQRSSDRS